METVLSIIAVLALLAFVVGMVKPTIVKCSSRGKAALIYLGIFIVCIGIGASISDDSGVLKSPEATSTSNKETPKEETPKEIPTLTKGSVYTLPYESSNVEIKFNDIKVKRISNGGLNLILSLVIKNSSNEVFFISDCGWRLLDSDKVEVEEAGIYEPMFGDFIPGSFFFTTVDPTVGKRAEVGYSVKPEIYYLSINGKIIAKLPLEQGQ